MLGQEVRGGAAPERAVVRGLGSNAEHWPLPGLAALRQPAAPGFALSEHMAAPRPPLSQFFAVRISNCACNSGPPDTTLRGALWCVSPPASPARSGAGLVTLWYCTDVPG